MANLLSTYFCSARLSGRAPKAGHSLVSQPEAGGIFNGKGQRRIL